MCAVTIMQCKLLQPNAGQPPDLSVLVAIYWCLSKQTLFIKSIINCLISRTQHVRSGVECGGVRDVAEQQHCLQNY